MLLDDDAGPGDKQSIVAHHLSAIRDVVIRTLRIVNI